jgi:hypothetical protein
MEHDLVVKVETGGAAPRVRACMEDVRWHCRIKNNTTVSTVCVEWTADGTSLEYNALDSLIRRIAASRAWSAEELITEIKKRLEDALGRAVAVTMSFQEREDLNIELSLE